MTPQLALDHLWTLAEGDPAALDAITFSGSDPGLPSVFRVGTLATSTIGAMALAASECFQLRGGARQDIGVDMHRALASFRSDRYLRVNDGPAPELRSPITGFYETRDERWVQLHTNFPHHLAGVLKVLGCEGDRDAVAKAIRGWDGVALDTRLAEAGLPAALIRSPKEWGTHEQAHAVANLPLFEIFRIGDAPPEPVAARERGDASRPLSGTRVLDLSRVIAGPVAGRALAQHGADVLMINGPHLPNIAPLVIDNGRGKRSATLDLREAADRDTLLALSRDADVFLQAYRPGALAARGFGPDALAEARPGLVYVSVCAYSHAGPWATRRGYDSLVQSASGIAWTEARATNTIGPKHLPCQALDYATGYLAAFGTMIALARRAREGGSWHVRLSLAQTGRWLQSMGQLEDGWRAPDVGFDEVRDCLVSCDSPFGKVTGIAPAERMPLTPPHFARPPVPIGTDAASWNA